MIDARLAELGIALPEPAAPVASYVPAVEIGGFLYISGQISFVDGKLMTGKIGDTRTVEDGILAARSCGLMLIAQMKKSERRQPRAGTPRPPRRGGGRGRGRGDRARY